MTLPDLVARLRTRQVEADAVKATAPVGDVLGWVLAELVVLVLAENGRAPEPANGHAPAPDAPDRLLRAPEVAKRLGCSARYVYAHAGRFPFTVRVGGLVRFSELRLDRWLARTTT